MNIEVGDILFFDGDLFTMYQAYSVKRSCLPDCDKAKCRDSCQGEEFVMVRSLAVIGKPVSKVCGQHRDGVKIK